MARDIFADYIKKQRSRGSLERANPPEAGRGAGADNETVTILREISSKLDSFNRLYAGSSAADPITAPLQGSGMVDLAVENGRVVLPDNGVFETNVYIKDGKIHSLGNNPGLKARRTVDARGKYVIPGIIDPHVHLGLFASMAAELESETRSALIGGVTTVGCYFGGRESHFRTFPRIAEEINRHSFVDIIPHLVIATEEQRREITDYIEHLGVTSFKVYMNGIPGLIPDVDDGFILDVFEEIRKSNKRCLVCSHAENRDIVRRAYEAVRAEKGDKATVQDWTDTHPDIAEEEAVMRLSFLAEKSKVPVYFVHISSGSAIGRLRKIKQSNKYVNIETTSPYLSITRNCASGNSIKMEPPFRDIEDVEELWKAVFDGVVDTIGTDNVTMTKAEKRTEDTLWNTISGYPAVETHLPVLLNEGVVKRGIAIDTLIGKLTKKPAELFGVYPKKGTLLPGSDADIVIVDMNMVKEVKASERSSRSDFSLYEGRRLKGWPVATIKSGELVVENGSWVGNNSNGKYIARK